MLTDTTLTTAHKRRLARLAKAAGCAPQARLDDVFKHGFDFVEQDIRETSKGLAEMEAGQGIPHSQVMAEARAIIERHARKTTVSGAG